METSRLTLQIKQKAQELGFPLVGVTNPEPPPHLDVYASWLEDGRHGEMAYLATERAFERRADPRRILPGCKSILVLGIPYDKPQEPKEPNAGNAHGRTAAYAWGNDYHEVLKVRLQALTAFIDEKVGAPVPSLWYTDTGPILERELAQRAGLGWIGKNSMLINPELGSYYLLAEILLGIELDLDSEITNDYCGSCTRCIEACPTSCILPDRTLDAKRCISYLTIELKGAIPTDLRPQMAAWVFGCDICQQVCPWNERFAAEAGDPAFSPRDETSLTDLEAELGLSPEKFNRRFRLSPVKRPKRRGYLRNVAVALGNAGQAGSVPALARGLQDGEALVRGHSAWALGQIGGQQAAKILENSLGQEEDDWVRDEIAAALKTIS